MARREYVRRFSRTERALHWIHAAAFFVLLGTGLVLYIPVLSEAVSNRPLLKAIHVDTAIAWLCALVLVVLVGDRPGLRRTLRELSLFDRDDRRWLLMRRRPQGRFNAGQKLNAAVTASFAVLFTVSGFLLWYGERDTRFRLDGAIVLHDGLTLLSALLVAGHLYLTLLHPPTRHSLHGMVFGTVDEEWATKHHSKWLHAVDDVPEAPGRSESPTD